MKRDSTGLAAKGIERILELSADEHIQRPGVGKDSRAFHNLMGAIMAYGKVLALLTAPQQREEFYAVVGRYEFSKCVAAVS